MRKLALLLLLSAAALSAANILPKAGLKGWTRLPIPPAAPLPMESQWKVDPATKNLVCEGNGGHDWLRYDTPLGDFDLHVEYRFTALPDPKARYNSGVFVRSASDYSTWVQVQTGPSDNGGFFFWVTPGPDGKPSRTSLKDKLPAQSPVKPAGEWNTYEISARGAVITVKTNGVETSRIEKAPLLEGHIGLEGEGFRIEFRKLELKKR